MRRSDDPPFYLYLPMAIFIAEINALFRAEKMEDKYMKHISKLVSAVLTAVMVMGIGASVSAATTKVALSKANFPDQTLRLYLKYTYDKNSNDYLDSDEISKITTLSFKGNEQVADYSGIKYLTSLKDLYISHGKFDVLDLTENSSISTVSISLTKINSIKTGSGVKTLILTQTNIKKIDVSKSDLSSLTMRGCDDLTLRKSTLDLSNSKSLKKVYIEDSNIRGIVFSSSASLESISIIKSYIRYLDITQCVKKGTFSNLVVVTHGAPYSPNGVPTSIATPGYLFNILTNKKYQTTVNGVQTTKYDSDDLYIYID